MSGLVKSENAKENKLYLPNFNSRVFRTRRLYSFFLQSRYLLTIIWLLYLKMVQSNQDGKYFAVFPKLLEISGLIKFWIYNLFSFVVSLYTKPDILKNIPPTGNCERTG